MSSLVTAINDFSLEFFIENFKQIKDENENILFSPICITATLAMLLYGAKGETATQMKKALHLNEVQSAEIGDSSATEPEHNAVWQTDAGSQCDQPGGIHSQLHTILSQLMKSMKDCDLKIVNRLFGAKTFDFYPHYLRCIKQLYYAEVERVDFGKETEKTRQQINSTVENQTHGKIKELFLPGSLDPHAALVLVSAFYFKGNWKFGFREEDTIEAPFWVNKNESKNVPMMVQTGTFNYVRIEEPPVQLIELPIADKNLCMLILLPKETHCSIDKLADTFMCQKLKEMIPSSAAMAERRVKVQIPRFKLEEECDLKASLTSMGMTRLFEPGKSDLSGISKQKPHVSQAIHMISMELNEAGNEGGAGTGIGAVQLNEECEEEFICNHSFLVTLVDRHSKLILYFGKVSSI